MGILYPSRHIISAPGSLLLSFYRPVAYSIDRTDVFTSSAVDALTIAYLFDIHGTDRDAFVTACASVLINTDTEKRYRIKERIDCPQRAKKPAKCSVAYAAKQNANAKDKDLP